MNKQLFKNEITAMMMEFNFWPVGGDAAFKQVIDVKYEILINRFKLTEREIKKCVNFFLMNGKDKYKKFPSSDDFLDVLGKSPKSMADKAWVYIKKAITHFGGGKSICFGPERKHFTLHEVIDHFGGWVDMCSKNYAEMERLEPLFKEKFIDIYSNAPKLNITKVVGQYPGETINVSAPAKAIEDKSSDGKTQYERIQEEQNEKNRKIFNKLGIEDEE